MIECTISERGNGFPGVGAYVTSHGADGLYRVVSVIDTIHTGGVGGANYIHAMVERADWSDTSSDDDVHSAVAHIA